MAGDGVSSEQGAGPLSRPVVEFLAARGVSEAEITGSFDAGTMALVVLDKLLFPRPGRYSQRDLLASVHVDPELPRSLWRAMGFPASSGDESDLFDDDIEVLRTALRGAQDAGVSDSDATGLMVRQTRAMSAAMSRIAEQMVDDLVNRFEQWREEGLSDGQMAELLITGTNVEPLRELLWYFFRRQYRAAAWRRLADPSRMGRSLPVAVGFVDLVRFAAITGRIPEDELEQLIVRFEEVAYDAITDGGGRVVKTIGDAVMYVAEDPQQATQVALDLVTAYAEDDLLPPARAGLALGPVLARDGDYYGPTVNLAARIVEVARPSNVVIADDLHGELVDTTAFVFDRLPPKRLKGIGSPTLWGVSAS